MLTKLACLLSAAIVSCVADASTTEARKLVVNVGASNLSTYAASGDSLGAYYVLQVQVPQELTETKLEWVILELYLDASSVEKNGYLEDTPVIEIYALNRQFPGRIEPNQFVTDPRPITHNVAVGSNRKMMIDVTEIVRSYLRNPTTNHGLIIGSLTGTREGLFSIKSDVVGQGAVARIIFLHG